MGVFATRSPFRPNPIGLSAVKLEEIVLNSSDGPVLRVSGADLMDGTPIIDIKPYLPYTDIRKDAEGGFAPEADKRIEVEIPDELIEKLPEGKRQALIAVLEQDPRPKYQNEPERIYGFVFSNYEVRFTVADDCLTVCDIEKF